MFEQWRGMMILMSFIALPCFLFFSLFLMFLLCIPGLVFGVVDRCIGILQDLFCIQPFAVLSRLASHGFLHEEFLASVYE